jgi:RNA polymerase sigma-70 factor, ECF subfamily
VRRGRGVSRDPAYAVSVASLKWSDWRIVAERVFKEESARILAGLIRVCRSFDWAEEARRTPLPGRFHDARRGARVDNGGFLVSLDDQDRSRWARRQIDKGMVVLARALRNPARQRYVLEAAIAGTHAHASSCEETNWVGIEGLYRQLMTVVSSPVIELNHAAAVAMSRGPAEGLQLVEALAARGELADYRGLYATRAELLRRLGRHSEALPNYERALGMTSNEVERSFLRARIGSLDRSERHG